jgi:nitrite reductase (NADH) small subunit
MSTAPPLSGSVILNIGSVERIPPGEGRAIQISNLSIAVFRARNGRVFATNASCSHRGGPLADGTIGNRTVVCPLHGCGYDMETGAAVGHNCGDVRTYPVRISDRGEMLIGVD